MSNGVSALPESHYPLLRWGNWLLALAGLIVVYVPTFVDLSRGAWQSDENVHGPMVLLVALYLFWLKRDIILAERRGNLLLGLALLVPGLLLYIVGRSQAILILEIGSQLPVLAGIVLALGGTAALRATAFPIAFLIFMVPLPGFLVDAVTGPLKQHVSVWADAILYALGYPISRAGVILTIGQYQLLVADACSGLHSMFTLSALGILYLYLVERQGWLHNAFVAACILPIAFFANVTRVIVLVLVTYHFGDEAGQGFIHGFAGMLLFIVALCLLFVVDAAVLRATATVSGKRRQVKS